MLRRLKGETLWTRRGAIGCFHGDGDSQEVQYQLEGELWFSGKRSVCANICRKMRWSIDVGATLASPSCYSRSCWAGGQITLSNRPLAYTKLLEVVEKNHSVTCNASIRLRQVRWEDDATGASFIRKRHHQTERSAPRGGLPRGNIQIDTSNGSSLARKIDF